MGRLVVICKDSTLHGLVWPTNAINRLTIKVTCGAISFLTMSVYTLVEIVIPQCYILKSKQFYVSWLIVPFSSLTLLVGRQEGHLACKKIEWWSAGVVICLERGADLHMAQLMSLPLTVSCFSKIQIDFAFLVPAHLGSPEKGPLNGCVCVINQIVSNYLNLLIFSTLKLSVNRRGIWP